MWRMLPVLAVAVFLVACSAVVEEKCSREEYLDLIEPYYEQWADVAKLAASTPRIALAPSIERLQEIRREVAALDVPECAEFTHESLVEFMSAQIDGFLAFLGDDEDGAEAKFAEANLIILAWKANVSTLDGE